MFHKVGRHLSYSNAAATMALVFALTGGAVAATSHSSGNPGGSRTIATALAGSAGSHVAVIAKKKTKAPARGPAGPKGATGATGPAGPSGSVGATGPQGAQGNAGSNGSNGAEGKAGASVTSSKESAGSNCENGGSKFVTGSSTTYACNGKNGTTGFTATLPAGKTETGVWSFGATLSSLVRIPISFAIPLKEKLEYRSNVGEPNEKNEVHYINAADKEVFYVVVEEAGVHIAKKEEVTSTKCPGTVIEPLAEPGNLCVYTQFMVSAEPFEVPIQNPEVGLPGAGTTGASLLMGAVGEKEGQGLGTWAVTAPTE